MNTYLSGVNRVQLLHTLFAGTNQEGTHRVGFRFTIVVHIINIIGQTRASKNIS